LDIINRALRKGRAVMFGKGWEKPGNGKVKGKELNRCDKGDGK